MHTIDISASAFVSLLQNVKITGRKTTTPAKTKSPLPCNAAVPKGPAFCFFNSQYHKKRGRFCASRVTYAANGQKPAVVLARNAQFQKSPVMSATENQPRQK